MRLFALLITLTFFTGSLIADEKPADAKKQETIQEKVVETTHALKTNGTEIPYKATTGTIVLKDKEGKDKAAVFFVAYTKEGVENLHDRPVTFCFNGGPGSSSVWLHLGALGPRRVDINQVGFDSPPYDLTDNIHSILDVTDLVFIDPVSTGYSKTVPGEDPKQFHGVEEDVASVGSFIRLWTTRYGRWESPKFLTGESYGSTRAAMLADHLHDTYGMYVNGIMLISTALNFNTINTTNHGNDLPYILALPSLTLAAQYHHRLPEELQKKQPQELIREVQEFAVTTYVSALMKGDSLPDAERKQIAETLARYTGISEEDILRANLRLSVAHFTKKLLRNDNKTIGRFDDRVVGDNIDDVQSLRDYDPSYEAIFGAFTASFYQYVSRELGWKTDDEYKVLTNVYPWNFGSESIMSLNASPNLREVMIKNPTLKVFVANGYYDLATPYFATDYTIDHLHLPKNLRSNINMAYYNGGHMMYTDLDNLAKLKQDLASFISNTLDNTH